MENTHDSSREIEPLPNSSKLSLRSTNLFSSIIIWAFLIYISLTSSYVPIQYGFEFFTTAGLDNSWVPPLLGTAALAFTVSAWYCLILFLMRAIVPMLFENQDAPPSESGKLLLAALVYTLVTAIIGVIILVFRRMSA